MRDSPDVENMPPDDDSGYITRGRIAVAAVLVVALVLVVVAAPSVQFGASEDPQNDSAANSSGPAGNATP